MVVGEEDLLQVRLQGGQVDDHVPRDAGQEPLDRALEREASLGSLHLGEVHLDDPVEGPAWGSCQLAWCARWPDLS